MNRLLVMSSFAVFCALGGCAAKPDHTAFATAAHDQVVALAAVSEPAGVTTIHAEPTQSHVRFRLGAGDALGHSMFASYVAYVRANRTDGEHYATGALKE